MLRSNKLVDQPIELKENLFSNRLMKAGTPAIVIVILLDGLNTLWEDQTSARRHVLKFLSTIQPTDRVALYSLGRGLRILHDFATDSSQLVAKLNKYRGANLPDLAASAMPKTPGDLLSVLDNDSTVPMLREAEFFTTQRVLNTLAAIVKADITQAMWSPLESTALALSARVDLNAKTNQLELIVQIDPSTLTIEQRADGWAGRLDLGFTQKDEEGKMYAP